MNIAKEVLEELHLLTPTENVLSLPTTPLLHYPKIKNLLQKAGGEYKKNAFHFESDAKIILDRLSGGETIETINIVREKNMIENSNEENVSTATIDNNRKPDELVYLDPKSLKRSKDGNPRDSITESDYNNLKSAIEANEGIHTPVAAWIVNGEPELIYGNTRTDICIDLGYELMPVLIKDIRTQEESLQLALSENIDRNKMTLLQESKGLKKVVLACSGDISAASSRMGWSESKFKKALQLLKATRKVQSLIGIKQPNGFTLSEAHASQLSLLLPKIQDRLVDAVIGNKFTVNQLSSQLKKSVAQKLSEATFCKKECDTCEYNSNQQDALLPMLGFDEDMCSNPLCFAEKTKEYFQGQAVEMEKEHGKVVLKSTLNGTTTISNDLVGEEQLKKCARCDMNCAVLNDKPELGQGQIIENQCIDSACLKEKMLVLMQSNITPLSVEEEPLQNEVVAINGSKNDIVKKTVVKKESTTKAETQKVASIPYRCKDNAQKEIRTIASNALKKHPNYELALTVASLLSTLGKGSLTTKVNLLLKKSEKELEALKKASIDELTTNYQSSSLNMEKTVIECARERTDNFQEKALEAWKPTIENLSLMTKQIRIMVLEDSGFTKAYKAEKSDKDYSALLTKKSNDQVLEILNFNFNWTNFAPDFFIDAIKKPFYHN